MFHMVKKKAAKTAPTTSIPRLDEKDKSILRLLQQDAKLTVRNIAARLHLTATPVHERIKRMEEAGVIQQYVALVNNRLVNKGLLVICHVSLKEHNRRAGSRFIKAIQGFTEVIECYNISGSFDFMLKIAVADMEAYHNFYVNRLSEIDGISHMQSSFVMGTMKQTHQLVY